MKKEIFLVGLLASAGPVSIGMAQSDFSLEDLNPHSATYGQMVGPSNYRGDVCVVFFGHET